MAMKYLFFFYCLAVPALAIGALDVDGSCRAQFHPIHESGSNVAIAGFLWDSLHQSDSEYAALLVPVLMKNKVYGIWYKLWRQLYERVLGIKFVHSGSNRQA